MVQSERTGGTMEPARSPRGTTTRPLNAIGFAAISTFSPDGSLSSNGLTGCVCACAYA